ncbi:Histidine kinase [Vibrio chagasii]|uniref:ATP-binding protein n=1 Tax=Vibrio chagasii TaxID=170679 RepID=UPI003389AE44|nr:Histidine kinase [Vibrio chagasii]CAH6812349.1 Histidine kinase [Vibrio chagasii]CAH6818397.1 Histidine kinase [Vibrio chagasii]CAH6967773.1 Histidine kinase [Vibrio chagasii]CAH6970102.1 Histidine kinase [Vibrio chagasii]
MEKTKSHFRVSSALKNIIGKDLIVDNFVAIFELVKNSFDANAVNVEVEFSKVIENIDDSKIVIKDDGKGMDLDDIENKWLFVAYSAKKEGTEDYRDEIKSQRVYAGAKGIGRFSCDRLGQKLIIYSRRSSHDNFSKLSVDWQDFELDMKDNFDNIGVVYEEVSECPYLLEVGTVLEISNLRSSWNEQKLLQLRQSLEKLINPSQDNGRSPFSINLIAKDYIEHDKEQVENGDDFKVINGRVKNFLFEKLELKTTRIDVSISQDGKHIITELFDRGLFVYKLTEELDSEYSHVLRNINFHLFSMNQSSKSLFTKYMGVRPVQFGSVFVYKNGFRVHPIGEVGRGDVFGLDGRKQQGTSRYFGTRDLVGRIEINGVNDYLTEASSRDGGLERNDAFYILSDFFKSNVLKRLERYAIDVVKYGSVNDIDISSFADEISDEKALEFIDSLTRGENIIDVSFNPDIFTVVHNSSEKSLRSLLKNLSKIAVGANNDDLNKEISKIESRISEFSKLAYDADLEAEREKKARIRAENLARKEAEIARTESLRAEEQTKIAKSESQRANQEAEKAKIVEKEIVAVKEKAEQVTKESLFLRSIVSSDIDNVVALHHHIGIAAGTIENYVRSVSKKIKSGKPVTTDTFLSVLDEISFVARQITSTTRFATKANFNLEAELINANLYDYIREYVLNICQGMIKVDGDYRNNIEFVWNEASDSEFVTEFRPLEIAMVLDTLINNSVKAKAKKITLTPVVDKGYISLEFLDDGKGIKKSIRKDVFEMGFTTSKGSGLGLHHAKSIMTKIKGNIELLDDDENRAKFLLTFNRG